MIITHVEQMHTQQFEGEYWLNQNLKGENVEIISSLVCILKFPFSRFNHILKYWVDQAGTIVSLYSFSKKYEEYNILSGTSKSARI